MPWGAAIGAAGAIGGSMISGKASADAAAAAAMQKFSSESAMGNATVDPRKKLITASGGVGSELADSFVNFGKTALGDLSRAQSGIVNFDPNSLLGLGAGGSAGSDPFRAAGRETLGLGRDVLAGFKNFDPNAFAATQFDRMNALAAPGEASAARATANQLFSRGRAGANDTHAGEVFRNLDLSQSQARDSRLLSAIGLAGQESDRMFNQGTGLLRSGADTTIGGEQIQASEIARLLAGLGGAQSMGGFQSNMRNALLTQATGAQQGITNAYAGQQQAIQNALAAATGQANAGANAGALQVAGANQIAQTMGEFGGTFGSAMYAS